MKPVGIDDLQQQNIPINKLSSEKTILDLVANEQIIRILDREVTAPYRPTYLKLKYGEKVYKTDLSKLIEFIRSILKEHNYDI